MNLCSSTAQENFSENLSICALVRGTRQSCQCFFLDSFWPVSQPYWKGSHLAEWFFNNPKYEYTNKNTIMPQLHDFKTGLCAKCFWHLVTIWELLFSNKKTWPNSFLICLYFFSPVLDIQPFDPIVWTLNMYVINYVT